ncbi:MAG: SGNH/GDSL hydrolase family protein [Microcoleus sp.]
MKDREILLIVASVVLTLIFSNLALFLKSFSATPFASQEIKQAARQIEIDGLRKQEQDFWRRIKDVDFDSQPKKAATAKTETSAIVPQQKTRKPPAKKPRLTRPYRKFLFVGDSVMLDLGTQIQYSLQEKYKITNTKLEYKVSSGLNRIDYYDWYARTREILSDYQPDVVVVLFGGNDTQDITDDRGKYRVIGTAEWQKTYRERVEKYAKLLAASSVRKVYWIGQSRSNKSHYRKLFPMMNDIYRSVSKSQPKITFISTWETFASGDEFAPVVADKSGKRGYIKVNDGLHFTLHGSRIVSDLIVDKMVADKILKTPAKKP